MIQLEVARTNSGQLHAFSAIELGNRSFYQVPWEAAGLDEGGGGQECDKEKEHVLLRI